MNKKNYLKFIGEVQQMIFDFVNTYKVPACCKLQQTADDDIQWTINLGDLYGSVNILLESWKSASYKGKVNVLAIPMKYHTYRDKENIFESRFKSVHGAVNEFNGKFVLNAFDNAQNELKNAFKEVLELWAYDKEIKSTINEPICMN